MKRQQREIQELVTEEVKRQLMVGYAVELHGLSVEDITELKIVTENVREKVWELDHDLTGIRIVLGLLGMCLLTFIIIDLIRWFS